MPYAAEGQISQAPIEGGIEITQDEYNQAMEAQLSGHTIAVRSEGLRILSLEERTVYSTEDQSEKQIPNNEDTPSGYTDTEPPGKHYNWNGSQWVLDQEAHRQSLIDTLADYRWQIETGGITVSNMPAHTDRDAQAKLTAARITAKEDSTYSVRWKVADGSFYTLDADTIISVADAVRGHVEAAFAAEADTVAEIEDGTLTSESQVKSRFDALINTTG